MKLFKTFLSACLAGISIALGGVAFLSLDSKVLGSLFFCVGLFTICTFGLNLFTGRVCYVFERPADYALSLPLIWLGNLAGTALTALAVRLTRLGPALQARAAQLCAAKLADTLPSLFLLGLLCNIFIYIAVDGYGKNPHEVGKYLSILFGVMGFLLCSLEHCVADMFYFSVAGVWSADTLLRMAVITLGNAAGGVLFPLCRSLIARK